MNRHAKPSSAASNPSQASGLSSFLRGAFATRGASRDANGSGAPISRASSRLLILCFATAAALAAFVSPALAITIDSTYSSPVATKEATLHATINPEGLATTYSFEYGTTTSYGSSTSSGGAGSGSVSRPVAKTIEGLSPDTTYHYRVVATNSGETLPGPDRTFTTFATHVAETSCANQAFRLGAGANLPDCRGYEMVSPVDKNGGDIAPLFFSSSPVFDMRASYNQADVAGQKMTYSSGTPFGDVISGRNSNQYMATRGTGGWSTHSINPPVRNVIGEPLNLIATLSPAFKLFTPSLATAWIQDASVPTLTPDASQGVPNLYRNNIGSGYEPLTTDVPSAIPGGYGLEFEYRVSGHSADYGEVAFGARTPLTPDAFPSTGEGMWQSYVSAGGQIRLLSILPTGLPQEALTTTEGGLGSSSPGAYDLFNPSGAPLGVVSDDGSRVFWTATQAPGIGAGRVYMRENPMQPQSALALGRGSGTGIITKGSNVVAEVSTSSGAFAVGQSITTSLVSTNSVEFFPPGTTITAVGADSLTLSANALEGTPSPWELNSWSECTEPAKACTIPVSETVPRGKGSNFEIANADGSKAFFTAPAPIGGETKDLYEIDAATRTSTLIAGEVRTPLVGASRDASRLYFVSKEALDAGASAGQPNLYLRQGGNITLIATVDSLDVNPGEGSGESGGATALSSRGALQGNRVSADGSHLLFMSQRKALSEEVANYDNTDAVSGEPDRQIYLFDVGAGLRCISCNPSGARPAGGRVERSFVTPGHGSAFKPVSERSKTDIWASAWFPGWEHELLAQRAMSDDGSRVFFNSFDALVPGDSNGVQDVYQWQLPGTGDCTESSPSFSELNEGCISLLSSGQSPQLSEFVDATPSGNDVYFTTGSSLIKPDPGLIDIYDARVGGGFDYPTTTPGCEGETCQGLPAAPNDATPASASYNGPGNVKEPAKKKKQKKSKKKGGKAKRAAANSTRSNG